MRRAMHALKKAVLASVVLQLAVASASDGQTARVDTSAYPGFYMAVGIGIPTGFRLELGHNWRCGFTYSITATTGDNWSRSPNDTKIGCLFKIHLARGDNEVRPYLFYAVGDEFKFFGGSDGYQIIGLGAAVRLSRQLRIRPEVGMASTHRYVSGGWSLFGNSTPEKYDVKQTLGFNLMLELNF